MKSEIFSFKLSKDHKQKLKKIAQKERRAMGAVLCNMIEDCSIKGEEKNVRGLDKTA